MNSFYNIEDFFLYNYLLIPAERIMATLLINYSFEWLPRFLQTKSILNNLSAMKTYRRKTANIPVTTSRSSNYVLCFAGNCLIDMLLKTIADDFIVWTQHEVQNINIINNINITNFILFIKLTSTEFTAAKYHDTLCIVWVNKKYLRTNQLSSLRNIYRFPEHFRT